MIMLKASPRVSIIIPTYNRSSLVEKAIRSVLEQTYQDFEIIVIDDASSDNTSDVVTEFDDARIKYIKLQKNGGQCFARNEGIKISSGKFIAFLDDDDEWLPEKLEYQLSAFEDGPENLGVVTCDALWLNDGSGAISAPGLCRELRGNVYDELIRHGGIYMVTMMVKKKCFDDVGLLDERVYRLEDFELAIRLSKKYNFGYIDHPLVIVHSHGNTHITKNIDLMLESHLYILGKYIDEFSVRPGAHSFFLSGIGHFYCLGGNAKQGRQYLFKAVKLSPYRMTYFGQLFLALCGSGVYTFATNMRARMRDFLSRYRVKFPGYAERL